MASTAQGSLVLVAGSGRSGTSTFAGVLQRLGYHVPQPEVPPDPTNPRGFAESRWVVDFHTRLLDGAGVQVADARPAAWPLAARAGLADAVRLELTGWLAEQLRVSRHLVVKDPRLTWFLPLWRRCAADVGVAPRCVTMVRHPAAVIDSKHRSYGGRLGSVARAAGWLNMMLYTERATRDMPRAFVAYDALLDDWTHCVADAGERLDLEPVREAPANAIRAAYEFVDRSLSRSSTDWDSLELPPPLRAQAETAWDLLALLAAGDPRAAADRFDATRAAYVELYEQAEAIAGSSIVAARRRSQPTDRVPARAARIVRRVPARYRRRVPLRWRRGIVRALAAR
jgi:hypothetical protein